MKHVLAAIDGRPSTHPVLEVAAVFARRLDVPVVALHVDEGDADAAIAMGRAHGVSTTIRHGDRSDVLVAALADPDVLLGVLGTRGLPIGRRPAGRTALDVVDRTATPLVLTPPDLGAWELPVNGTTLVPVENGEERQDALPRLLALLRELRQRVHLVHVFSPETLPTYVDQAQYALPAWAQEFAARHGGEDLHVELRVGYPDREVLECARTSSADLVARARPSRMRLQNEVILHEVLAHSRCPVLLMPAGDVDETS